MVKRRVKEHDAVLRQNDEGPQPQRAAAVEEPKAAEGLMTFTSPGYATTDLERRYEYAISERGEYLVKDSAGTFAVKRAVDGAVVLAPGQSAATIATRARAVDPTL